MRDIEFVSGIQASRDLRRRILDYFGAEHGLTRGDDSSSVITWLASDLLTEFHVNESSLEAVNYSTLTVRTLTAGIADFEQALKWANGLNDVTSLNRWWVINKPGVLGPYEDEPGYGGEPCLISEVSFQCGVPFTDVPDEVVFMIVGEQIARASALSTNEFYRDWGISKSMRMTINDVPAFGSFNPIVNFFDKIIGKGSQEDSLALYDIADRALSSAIDLQERNNEIPWATNYPGGSIQFLVPFKSQSRGEVTLVSILPFINPQLGPGLMVAMNSNIDANGDHHGDYADSLNKLGTGWFPGFAHCYGAWAEVEGALIYKIFIPAAWIHLVSENALFNFFRTTFENFARVSVSAFMYEAAEFLNTAANPGLMAVGEAARGYAYGEPGFGVDEL